jgi:hypothetical protein
MLQGLYWPIDQRGVGGVLLGGVGSAIRRVSDRHGEIV